ncbi:MAG TPA: hypothetical protein VGH99_11065 [Pseudonocardia sp.]
MRDQVARLPLAGVVLPEARTREQVHLGELGGTWLLSLIRHRF